MIQSFIFTGFLGVGKTTMLSNAIKEYFSDKKVALIVNEFGEIGIDGAILKNVHSEVLEISQGCICCQLTDTFSDGVKEIVQKYDPEIVFVETSGVSEPFPIFFALYKLGISIEGIICVVDSKNFDLYKESSSAKNQIGGSNIIILNKTDLVNEAELKALTKEIKEIKNEYDVKDFSGIKVFNNYMIEHAVQGKVSQKVFKSIYKTDEIIEISQENNYHDHTDSDGVTQKVCYIKKDTTAEEIETLLASLSKNVYRAKGIVKLKELEKKQLINYAFGYVSSEDIDLDDQQDVFVFIGESIDEEINSLARKLDYLLIPRFTIKPEGIKEFMG